MAMNILIEVPRRVLPASTRRTIKSVLEQVQTRASGLPPARLRSWISPLWFDFEKTGRDQLEFFVELAGLTRSSSFLDIASGVGRIAIPLAGFMDKRGRYEGFDIKEELVEWCRAHITKKHPNFRFKVADVATTWSPNRGASVDTYVFPYDDMQFDFAYAGSIYTHILPGGALNYLKQTARVLKPGGSAVSTWLIYNSHTSRATSTNSSLAKNWPIDRGEFRLKQEDCPEASVAYEELKVRAMYNEAGLEILEPFRPDASYQSSRIPQDRSAGIHLHYALSIIARRPAAR